MNALELRLILKELRAIRSGVEKLIKMRKENDYLENRHRQFMEEQAEASNEKPCDRCGGKHVGRSTCPAKGGW